MWVKDEGFTPGALQPTGAREIGKQPGATAGKEGRRERTETAFFGDFWDPRYVDAAT